MELRILGELFVSKTDTTSVSVFSNCMCSLLCPISRYYSQKQNKKQFGTLAQRTPNNPKREPCQQLSAKMQLYLTELHGCVKRRSTQSDFNHIVEAIKYHNYFQRPESVVLTKASVKLQSGRARGQKSQMWQKAWWLHHHLWFVLCNGSRNCSRFLIMVPRKPVLEESTVITVCCATFSWRLTTVSSTHFPTENFWVIISNN